MIKEKDIVELIDESEFPEWAGRMTVVAISNDDYDEYATCVHPEMNVGAFLLDKLVVMEEAE